MGILKSLLHFFIPRERTVIYTTFDQADYFKVKSILSNAAIPHRSKIQGGMRELTRRTHFGGKTRTQYDLLVRKEDEHKALNKIR